MSKIKILLVDDCVDFLRVLSVRVTSWGYDIIEAKDGNEAVKVMKEKKPDIVILDYLMPKMDGVATLREIRKIDSKIPVVMFTAHPNEEVMKDVEKLGIDAFVHKLSVYTDTLGALKTSIGIIAKNLKADQWSLVS